MKDGNTLIPIDETNITNLIYTIRVKQVMIDRDLADLYQVQTKRLNEQVKRNLARFPEEFCFRLSTEEKNEPVANCDRFTTLKHSSSNPYDFTEQGITMLSAVLKSDIFFAIIIGMLYIDCGSDSQRTAKIIDCHGNRNGVSCHNYDNGM